MSMICPSCDTRMVVKDVRVDNDGPVRRYKCPKCDLQMWTEEVEITEREFNERANAVMRSKYKQGDKYGCSKRN